MLINLSKPWGGWVLIPTQAGKEESEIKADRRAAPFPSSQTYHPKETASPPATPEDKESEKAFFQCKLIWSPRHESSKA